MKNVHVVLLAAAFCVLTFTGAGGEEIIHGKKATKNTLQYMASVQSENTHICGGFLIAPGYVLTAAHCDQPNLNVVLGSPNIDPKKKKLKRYAVKSVHKHPSYEDVYAGFDLMLLKLSAKVNRKDKSIKIINISKKGRRVNPNTKCTVGGWGRTEKQKTVFDLMVTDVATVDISTCKKAWRKELPLPDNVMCAGGYASRHGACQGDSGGPLVCKDLAVGIVSFNFKRNCTYPNLPNVYTEIAPYADWINNIIKGNP